MPSKSSERFADIKFKGGTITVSSFGYILKWNQKHYGAKLVTGYRIYNNTYVHRLVAYAFGLISDLKEPIEVDHIDCNRGNNRLKNLRIVTKQENLSFRKKTRNVKIFVKYNDVKGIFDSEVAAANAIGISLNKIRYYSTHDYRPKGLILRRLSK